MNAILFLFLLLLSTNASILDLQTANSEPPSPSFAGFQYPSAMSVKRPRGLILKSKVRSENNLILLVLDTVQSFTVRQKRADFNSFFKIQFEGCKSDPYVLVQQRSNKSNLWDVCFYTNYMNPCYNFKVSFSYSDENYNGALLSVPIEFSKLDYFSMYQYVGKQRRNQF